MKVKLVVGYGLIGVGVIGSHMIAFLEGYKKGFSKACNECNVLIEETIKNNKPSKEEKK